MLCLKIQNENRHAKTSFSQISRKCDFDNTHNHPYIHILARSHASTRIHLEQFDICRINPFKPKRFSNLISWMSPLYNFRAVGRHFFFNF